MIIVGHFRRLTFKEKEYCFIVEHYAVSYYFDCSKWRIQHNVLLKSYSAVFSYIPPALHRQNHRVFGAFSTAYRDTTLYLDIR